MRQYNYYLGLEDQSFIDMLQPHLNGFIFDNELEEKAAISNESNILILNYDGKIRLYASNKVVVIFANFTLSGINVNLVNTIKNAVKEYETTCDDEIVIHVFKEF